jgi:hypothetical protein
MVELRFAASDSTGVQSRYEYRLDEETSMPTSSSILLWIGIPVLLIGVILGASDKEKVGFAVWLTILGIGCIIAAIAILVAR